MRVHLIHAHSEADSFVAAMRDVIVDEFQAQGANVSVSDLYAMGFNPVASADDFTSRKNPDHLVTALEQRHGFETGSLANDIAAEVEKLLAADIIAFTFPLHWFSVPAILKGYIDRVFLSGPFYGGRRIYAQGGLAGKRAFAAFSLGGRENMFGENTIHGPLETGMMRHFFQGTLGYVGLSVRKPFIAHHVPYLDDAARLELLDSLGRYVRDLEEQPFMEMPDLSLFDETFKPKS